MGTALVSTTLTMAIGCRVSSRSRNCRFSWSNLVESGESTHSIIDSTVRNPIAIYVDTVLKSVLPNTVESGYIILPRTGPKWLI